MKNPTKTEDEVCIDRQAKGDCPLQKLIVGHVAGELSPKDEHECPNCKEKTKRDHR